MKYKIYSCALWFICLSSIAGCGDMWHSLFGSDEGNITADGGAPVCMRDTRDNLLASLSRTCNQSSECPAGAFCDIDVGGFCNFQCMDSSECPSSQTCNCFGQCVGAMSGDAGATLDPACPKNVSLITNPSTQGRACDHDDTCPYGMYCSSQTGKCAADCTTDSQCTVAGSDGGTARCDCFGRCIATGGTGPRPQRRLPQLGATPSAIFAAGTSDRAWMYQIELSVTTSDVDLTTTQQLDGSGNTVKLPLTTPVTVELPPDVEASCTLDANSNPIFDAAHRCTSLPAAGDKWDFSTTTGGGFRATQEIWLRHTPNAAAPTSRWSIRFHSAGLDSSPAVVDVNLSGQALPPAGGWVTGFTSAPAAGAGYSGVVSFTPPSQAVDSTGALGDSAEIHVPVRAWVKSTGLVLFDDAHAFSAGGQIPVSASGPTDVTWLDIVPELSPLFVNSVTGGIRATTTILDPHFKTNTASMMGTIDIALDLNGSPSHMGLRYRLSPDSSVNCAAAGSCPQTWKPWVGPGIHGLDVTTDAIFNSLQGLPLTVEGVVCGSQNGAFNRMSLFFGADPSLSTHFTTNISPFSGDFTCVNPYTGSETLPMAFSLLSYQDKVQQEKIDPAATSADLLADCLSQLEDPTVFDTLPERCINVAAMTEALLWARGSLIDPLGATTVAVNGQTLNLNASRLFHRLIQQWLATHSFLASQGLQEWDLHQVLASASTTVAGDAPDAADPSRLLKRMEAAWAYTLFNAITIVYPSQEFNNPTAFGFLTLPGAVLRSPDYRTEYLPGNHPSLAPTFELSHGHEQAIGLPVNLLETLTWHLKLLDRYLDDASVQAYLAALDGGTSSLRNTALEKIGTTLAYGAAVEAVATRLYGVAAAGGAVPWKTRWDVARNELAAVRTRITSRGSELAQGRNPLGIADDDTPIFFGDPTGTNAKFFASSDYLMNTWAVSAVSSAQGALGQARDAWLNARNSQIQSQMTQTDRDRRLQDLKSRYGQTLIDNCGITGKNSWEVLDSIPQENLLETCFIDPNPLLACDATNVLPPSTVPEDPAVFRQNIIQKYGDDHTVDPRMRLCLINKLDLSVHTPTAINVCAKTYTVWVKYASSNPNAKPRKENRLCTDATKTQCCKLETTDVVTIKPLDSVIDPVEMAAAYTQCQDELSVSNDIMPGTTLNRQCFRGRIGAQVMENVGAMQDIFVAKFQWKQQQREYRLQADNCVAVEQAQTSIKRNTAEFESTTLKWDESRYLYDQAANALQTASAAIGGVSITNWGSGAAAGLEVAAGVARGFSIDAAKHLEDARTHYNAFMTTIQANEEIRKCWVDAERVKLGIDTASLQVSRRQTDLNAGVIVLADMIRQTKQAFNEGKTAVAREEARYVSTVAHHYWLGEKIDRFHREFDWAKRLTYLAMRAVEYEFQQSFPLREQILSASHPDQLEQAIRQLQQELATRTINRRRPEQASAVLSLRDDVLGITDRLDVPPGERAWSAAQRFKGRLWDHAYAVYDEGGNWLGQGVPFNLTPQGVLKDRCAERLWTVTATIQGDALSSEAPAAPLLLLKNNTFSSQWCMGHDGGTLAQVASVQPSRQLFRPGSDADPVAEQNRYVSALITPFFNVRRSDFYRSEFQEGSSNELAGRGLYGDYILLFPKELLEGAASLVKDSGVVHEKFPLDRVEDVLLRFDYLSVDDLPNLSQ